MSFGLKPAKWRRTSKARGRAARILDITELSVPKALSAMRQRVAMGGPSRNWSFFDEPLSNLDAKLRVQMRIEIKRVHQMVKTTTVYVTHDQVEAMTLADRVVVMNNGSIEQIAKPQELYHHPRTRFVAGFIGSPAMNFMRCRLEENGSELRARVSELISLPVPAAHAVRFRSLAGKELIFGLRPEHITVPRQRPRRQESRYRSTSSSRWAWRHCVFRHRRPAICGHDPAAARSRAKSCGRCHGSHALIDPSSGTVL
jgi:multiple sugar transport system ATP-binding protein